jgi:hypothetical protein
MNISQSGMVTKVIDALLVDKIITPSFWRLYFQAPDIDQSTPFIVDRTKLRPDQNAFFEYINIGEQFDFNYKHKIIRSANFKVIISYHYSPNKKVTNQFELYQNSNKNWYDYVVNYLTPSPNIAYSSVLSS